jgi:hypothetical protein
LNLETFLLADHAAAAPDRKLYINGAGITRLTAPTVPFALPFLSVVLVFGIGHSDVGEHWLLVRLQDPQGIEMLPPDPTGILVPEPEGPEDEEHFVQVVMSFGGVPILALGTYRFTVELDGKSIRTFRLPVVPASPTSDQTSLPSTQ